MDATRELAAILQTRARCLPLRSELVGWPNDQFKQNRPRSDPRPVCCVKSCAGGFRPVQKRYLVISTSLVSGRKKKPMTTVIAAKMIGYQRPAEISPVEATTGNRVAGKGPPNQPLPMW